MPNEIFQSYKNKLKDRIYGVLCQKEKDGEWQKFLDSIIVELMGHESSSINWWCLIGKLGALKFLSYDYFRKTIFQCMHLVDKLNELH